MDFAVGLIAIAFGGWLMWLTIRRGWHWVYCVLGVAMVVGGAVLLAPAPAFAETRAADVKAWVCKKLPSLKRCPRPATATVPLPPSRPVEIVPAPEALPVPAPVPAWPDPPKLEPMPAPAPNQPVVAAPALPQVQSKADPPKQADRSKTFRKEGQQRTKTSPQQEQPREPISGGGQASPVKCTPLPPKDCEQICKYARMMSVAAAESLAVFWGYCRPTPSQRAGGKACIRSHCPEVLTKK